MPLRCGIVGLPNVGKSTLFNALTSGKALAANYPFATKDPNVGIIIVPDKRLDALTDIFEPQVTTPTTIEIVDIAGLIKGASKGEGLGNQFLANIRQVDAIIHVVRCFEDENVVHVDGNIDPARDKEIIDMELLFKDIETCEKRLEKLAKMAKSGEKQAIKDVENLTLILKHLESGMPARALLLDEEANELLKSMFLLTNKKVLYVCNVDEKSVIKGNVFSKAIAEVVDPENSEVLIINADMEAQIAELEDPEERSEFLSELGLSESGLDRVIRASYKLLHLITFFTGGPKEVRAWTIREGCKAPKAAGVIHTDFEKGFIRAEVIKYDILVAYQSEKAVKEAGKMNIEGKEYVVHDGDVMHYLFNV